MTPERLQEITYAARISDANYSHGHIGISEREAWDAIVHRSELLDRVADLTHQRDTARRCMEDARRIAIEAGAFLLTCGSCGVTSNDVERIPCGYSVEIHDDESLHDVCPLCEREHLDDI